MRLITRNVYRAIPELDGFSDETCRRIVAQVYRLRWIGISIAMLAAVVLSLPITVAAVLVVVHFIGENIWAPKSELQSSLVFAAIITSIVGVPGILAFMVRDYILRIGCEWLVKRNERCPACRYPLTGLRTAPDQTVRCPECGTDCVPDSAVAELAASINSTTPPPSSSPHH